MPQEMKDNLIHTRECVPEFYMLRLELELQLQ